MTDCKQQVFQFQGLKSRKVTADFTGGYLSSDAGGGLFLREVESRHGIIEELSECFVDGRDQRYVEHSVKELLAQRINGIVLGYEDLNDHDRLRLDPVHALLAGKDDLTGEDRAKEADRGRALAGRSTLNRLELGACGGDERYCRIVAQADKIEQLLIREGVKAIPCESEEIVLDFDATDDPLHGNQEGAYFHGYYKNYCYLPLYCFCGNIPLWAQLRDCKRDASEGTVEALAKIVPAIRRGLGKKVRIVVRGDSGFARESIMSYCEQNGLYYCFGLAKNAVLKGLLEKTFEKMHEQIEAGECTLPYRQFVEFGYRTRESWSRFRRVVGKAEVLDKGDNPRFVVTNLPAEGFAEEDAQRFAPAPLYEQFYCARGDMENRIKEQQLELFADRTSTHMKGSNQLCLWFSAIAHLIVSRVKAEVLKGTRWARASIGQIRLQLFKIAARVRLSCRRMHFELASAYPYWHDFAKAHSNLQTAGFT